MASLCPQWLQYAPLPPTMAPFNPPPWAIAPSLTACVRRAPDTKGGVSRFSEHFTSIHRGRDKSDFPTSPQAEQKLGALPSPPKCNLCLVGWGSTLCLRITVKTWFLIILPPAKNICIKTGFFCPLRRAKRKLGGEVWGQRGLEALKWRPRRSADRLNYTVESLLGK